MTVVLLKSGLALPFPRVGLAATSVTLGWLMPDTWYEKCPAVKLGRTVPSFEETFKGYLPGGNG